MALVFVFGTLKEGFPNFHVNKGERVPGSYLTVDRYPLYVVSRYHIPWLMNEPGTGYRVKGELYEVDADGLASMDELERVGHPEGYERHTIDVSHEGSGDISSVYIYLIPPSRLADATKQAGPLDEYTLAHASRFTFP